MNRLSPRCLNWVPVFAVLALVIVVLLTGCSSLPEQVAVRIETEAKPEPRHAPVNHVGVAHLPPEVRRVVLLPVSGGALLTPEAAAALDPVFAAALQRRMRFEVVPVSRAWCRRYFGAEEFSSAAALPHDFLARLGADHAADGVLFVDVTCAPSSRPWPARGCSGATTRSSPPTMPPWPRAPRPMPGPMPAPVGRST
jgi:hypothetical protein